MGVYNHRPWSRHLHQTRSSGWLVCLPSDLRSQALHQPYITAEPPLRGTATSIKCRSTTTPICVPNRDSLFVLMFCPRVYYYILANHPALFPMDGTCLLASLPFLVASWRGGTKCLCLSCCPSMIFVYLFLPHLQYRLDGRGGGLQSQSVSHSLSGSVCRAWSI